ncbi:MAG: hypothetical protein JRI77_00955 [Deltaproteobacteria bacterium]|nr:hypothetical protein [Deltaproteobacteria bacterium]
MRDTSAETSKRKSIPDHLLEHLYRIFWDGVNHFVDEKGNMRTVYGAASNAVVTILPEECPVELNDASDNEYARTYLEWFYEVVQAQDCFRPDILMDWYCDPDPQSSISEIDLENIDYANLSDKQIEKLNTLKEQIRGYLSDMEAKPGDDTW